MKIAITKSNTGFQNYLDWLEFFKVDYLILDWQEKNIINKFKDCSCIILTGGTDIYPGFYCNEEIENENIYTPERDKFEFELIDKAIEKKKPVLGICRGNQLLNVYFKGNLISDLEKIKGVNHRKISDSEVRNHKVIIKKGSMLFNIIGTEEGIVTSTHHQAVDNVGIGLIKNAVSDDGIIEGIEFEDKIGKSFLLGIQWHPERYSDFNNIFSKNVLKRFIEESGNI